MKPILIAILAFLPLTSAFGQYTFGVKQKGSKAKEADAPYTIRVIASTTEEYNVEVSIKDVAIGEAVLFGETFCTVDVGDWTTLSEEGKPALPRFVQMLALPSLTSKIKQISVEELAWDTIPVGRIIPQQRVLEENEKPTALDIDMNVYQGQEYVPERIFQNKTSIYRRIANTSVSICPFKYDIAGGRLFILKEFRLQTQFLNDANTPMQTHIRARGADMLFDNVVRAEASPDFPQNPPAYTSNEDNGRYNYLIIVGDIPDVEDSDILKEFCKWKALMGYKTKVVTTATTGSTDIGIKAYIQSEFDNYDIDYVLFIGNARKIPLHRTPKRKEAIGVILSDYWYGCMDGDEDLEGDVGIGRYSVLSLSELENAIRKSIGYESGDYANGDSVVLMAHQERAPAKFQACLENIRNTYINSDFHFIKAYGAAVSLGGNEATNEDIVNYINQGINILNYRGHGEPSDWPYDWNVSDSTDFFINEVESLTNTKYPVVFSVACYTGDIGWVGAGLMERFIRSEHGAAAALGATEPSYNVINDAYNKKLFKYLCEEEDWHDIGLLNLTSHVTTMNSYSGDNYLRAIDNTFMYACHGDPSLELWSGPICSFPEPEVSITDNNITIRFSDVQNFVIHVVKADGTRMENRIIYGNYFTIQNPTSAIHISVCKHNYKPYIIDCSISGSIAVANIKRHTINISSPVLLGVDPNVPLLQGAFFVEDGAILQLRQDSRATLGKGFSCKLGGKLIIK